MDMHKYPGCISNPIQQVGYVPLEVHTYPYIYPYVSNISMSIHTYPHGPSSQMFLMFYCLVLFGSLLDPFVGSLAFAFVLSIFEIDAN
jgi:hypothetical protein